MMQKHADNPVTKERRERFLSLQSVIEMRARERALALPNPGTFRELLDPFDHLESPWLPLQGVVPESDDGVILARGQLAGRPALNHGDRGRVPGRHGGSVREQDRRRTGSGAVRLRERQADPAGASAGDRRRSPAGGRHLIWNLMGGEQRHQIGFVDALTEDALS